MELKIGDVFAISTAKGTGYLQYVYTDREDIEFVRILSGLFKGLQPKLDVIVRQPERYVVGFPVSAAFRRKIIERTGTYVVPDWFGMPRYFRSPHRVRGENLGWHIIDNWDWSRRFVQQLSPTEKLLSPAGIWNDTLLKERLESDWSLETWG